jgi:hypothetical protein
MCALGPAPQIDAQGMRTVDPHKEDDMNRPRLTSVAAFAPALLMLAVFAAGCSSRPEDAMLRQFFRASQLRDNATLASFAAATFDPTTDGVVSSFDIVSVSEETSQPLMLKELAKAEEDARAADSELSRNMKAYQDANLEAIERVLKAETAGRPAVGRDAPVQAAWRKWRDDAAASAKAVSDARAKVNADRPVVELSLQASGQPSVDATTVEGQMVSKQVTMDAQVRMPSGETVQKQLVATMVQARINAPDAPQPQMGRWVITSVQG